MGTVMLKVLLLFSLLLLLPFLSGCITENNAEKDTMELKETACNSAEAGNTCNTKLEDLSLVTKDECCQIFGKCC